MAMSEKKRHRQAKILTRTVAAYAYAAHDTDDALRLIATVACRLTVGVCRRTKDPLTTLEKLKDIVQEELKEYSNADRPHQLEDEDKGLQRQAGAVQGRDGQELQTTPTT